MSAQIQPLVASVQVYSISHSSCSENSVKTPASASDWDMVNDLSAGSCLCSKLGFRHKGPSAGGLTAGTSRYKVPGFQAPESSYKMKELAICLLISFKKRSSLGAFYSAYSICCGFFKEVPQMLHALHFQLLVGGTPVSVALFLLVCNLLLNC